MVRHILITFINMLWDVCWPLLLGFVISAIIRSFISTSTISKRLGKTTPKGIALSTFFGAISSSCSYAAASMSKTLIAQGASWANAVAFMIASTNLVFEIFLVIVTLLGWAFFGAEIMGGILFIIIGAIFMKLFLSKRAIDKAKKHIKDTEAGFSKNDAHAHHGHTMTGNEKHTDHNDKRHGKVASAKSHSPSFLKKGKDAAGYFYMDITMVGKDILLGVAIASILAVVVPPHLWQWLFLQKSADYPSFIVVMWNAVVGIVIGLLAFVCSVGNILLAAVLWRGGISFSGVIAFILADLITIPILLVYRRYYGIKMMWRLLLVLIFSILITAVSVDYIFQWGDWIPQRPGREIGMQISSIQWNYKAILNIIFLPLSIIGFFLGKKMMKKKMS